MTEFLPRIDAPIVEIAGKRYPMTREFYSALSRAFQTLGDSDAALAANDAAITAILQSLGAEDVASLQALGDLLAGKQDADEALDALSQLTATGLLSFTGGNFNSRTLSPVAGETTVTNGNGVAGNPTVGLANVADSGAGSLLAVTRDGKGRITGTKAATITGTAGRVAVANGDASAGLPTIDLATVTDAGGGTLQRTAFDAYGRKTGTSAATTDHLTEGAANLYHTAQRVRDVMLTGLSTATNAVITATDTVLSAFGKLQAQVTANLATLTSHTGNTSNPHSVTKAQVGLGNADNTSDVNKPVSTAQQTALDAKFDKVGGNIAGDTLVGTTATSLTAGTARTLSVSAGTSGDSTGGMNIEGSRAASGALFARFGFWHQGTLVASFNSIRGAVDEGSFAIATKVTAGGLNFRWEVTSAGHFLPWADNTYNHGSASKRSKEIFCANSVINTSDAREKTPPRDLTAQELACANELARLPCVFRWLHAIEEKGDEARLHISPTVQSVIACMESHELDPFRYGFVCYDAWGEEVRPAVLGEDGREVEPATIIPAGDRYSLRPTELAHFIMRGIVARQDAMEARLAAMEG